uniref:Uncharacterized protein n=1 Tax=Anopheles dirus TaxID=7168 RepID=A0A182NVH3_9DIPT
MSSETEEELERVLRAYCNIMTTNPVLLQQQLALHAVLEWNGRFVCGRRHIIRFLLHKQRAGALHGHWFERPQPWNPTADSSARAHHLSKATSAARKGRSERSSHEDSSQANRSTTQPTTTTTSSGSSNTNTVTNLETEDLGVTMLGSTSFAEEETATGHGQLSVAPSAEEAAAAAGFRTPPHATAGHGQRPVAPFSYQALHYGELARDTDDESDSSSSTSDSFDPTKQTNDDGAEYDELQSLQASGTMAGSLCAGNEGSCSSSTGTTANITRLALSYRVQKSNREPRYTLIVYDCPLFRSERNTVRRKLLFETEEMQHPDAATTNRAAPAKPLPVPPGTPIKRRRNVGVPAGAIQPVPVRTQRKHPSSMGRTERKQSRLASSVSDVSRGGQSSGVVGSSVSGSGNAATTLIRLGNTPAEQTNVARPNRFPRPLVPGTQLIREDDGACAI